MIDTIDPFKCLTDKEIRTAIANARGVNPELMIPEEAVRILIKQQIPRLESPCQQICELVYDQMLENVSLVEYDQLQKYTKLFSYIHETMTNLLQQYKKSVTLMICNIIASESSYINFDHDDFLYLKPFCLLEKIPEEHDLIRIEQNLKVDRDYFTEEFNKEDLDQTHISPAYDDDFQQENTNIRAPELSSKEKEYMPSYNPSEHIKKNAEPIILKKVKDKLEVRSEATPKEERQVSIMRRLIICYFSIIKKQIKDIVPKQVVCHLVQETKKKMATRLIIGLKDYANKKEMLEEDPQDKFEREKLNANVKALTAAMNAIERARDDPKNSKRALAKEESKSKEPRSRVREPSSEATVSTPKKKSKKQDKKKDKEKDDYSDTEIIT